MENEQLKIRLQEHANELLNYLEQGVEFVKDQAPHVVQEILNWGLASNLTFCLICLTSGIFAILIIKYRFIPAVRKDEDVAVLWGFCSAIMGVPSAIIGCMSLLNLIKVLVAPRLYIIQQLQILF